MPASHIHPLLLSQETDGGDLCSLEVDMEGSRWGEQGRGLHGDRRTFSLGENKGWYICNCYPANLIRAPESQKLNLESLLNLKISYISQVLSRGKLQKSNPSGWGLIIPGTAPLSK